MKRVYLLALATAALSGCVSRVVPTVMGESPSPENLNTVIMEPQPTPLINVSVDSTSTLSPDKKWIATIATAALLQENGGPLGAELVIRITNSSDASNSRVALSQSLPGYAGMMGFEPLHWSRDGHFVDIGQWWAPSGCQLGESESEWTRFDLVSGEATSLVTASVLAFSPDDDGIAFVRADGLDSQLVIRDPLSAADRSIPVPNDLGDAIGLTWAPNSEALTILFVEKACDVGQESRTIAVTQVSELDLRVVLSEDKDLSYIARWGENDRLLVVDRQQRYRWLSLETGEYLGDPMVAPP